MNLTNPEAKTVVEEVGYDPDYNEYYTETVLAGHAVLDSPVDALKVEPARYEGIFVGSVTDPDVVAQLVALLPEECLVAPVKAAYDKYLELHEEGNEFFGQDEPAMSYEEFFGTRFRGFHVYRNAEGKVTLNWDAVLAHNE